MYGDAAFETLRVYGGEIFEWAAHADRLEATCETLGFADAVPPRADLRERVRDTLAANGLADAYAKISVTRGVQPGKLTPETTVDPTVVVLADPLPRGGPDSIRVWDRPASITTVDAQSIPDDAIPADAKTHNYLDGILARLAVRDTEYDEAIRRSTAGFLTEGATSNLFFLEGGRLLTPTTALPLLPGVTRRVVTDLARAADIPVDTGRYEPARLCEADEVFLTNSTWEIRPVTRVGDTSLDVGPITRTLQDAYDERVAALYDGQ
jgi:branched-chain amino acid aminotransferase